MHGLLLQVTTKLKVLYSCSTMFSSREYCSGTSARRLKPPWRIMFFGTDDFAVKFLTELNNDRMSGKHVVQSLSVTVPKHKGAVRRYAEDHGLEVNEWPVIPTSDKYDVGIIVSFGHLIPEKVITAFPNGILNVHPSLLPKWRGASPIFHSLLSGDKQTGITIMDIAATKFDVGPILLQKPFTIPNDCTTFQLQDLAVKHGKAMLMNSLKALLTIQRSDQIGKPCYASKLKSDCGKLNWEKQTMADIDRHCRALSEVFGIKALWNNQRIRLQDFIKPSQMINPAIQEDLVHLEKNGLKSAGFPFYHRGQKILCVKCKDGWVGFKKIVIRKPMSAEGFYNGYLSKPNFNKLLFISEDNGLHRYWGSHSK